MVTKALFMSNRSRPDIIPTVSVLSRRIRSFNQSYWVKRRRLVRYLLSTRNKHLILCYDGMSIAKWHVDAAFAVHEDFKSHLEGTMMLSQASGSMKQRLNTRSSTIAELVAVDDLLGKLLWVKRFLTAMGYPLKENILLQDNTSAILMEKNGQSCLGKRNRTIDVRYFVIKDIIDKGEVQIQHCPTKEMVSDFLPSLYKARSFSNSGN